MTEASDVLVSIGTIVYFQKKMSEEIIFFHFAGWAWEADRDWETDVNNGNSDTDGWSYSPDFGHFTDSFSGSSIKVTFCSS